MASKGLLLVICVWSLNVFAEIKIGFVDLQKAMLQTSDGQRAKKILETEFQKHQEALSKMEANMRKMGEEFERKAGLLAREAKEKRQTELQSEWRKFEQAVAQNQAEMTKRQQDLLEPISRKLGAIVEGLGKKEKFTVILSPQGVVFAGREVDLTDRVVKEYEKG